MDINVESGYKYKLQHITLLSELVGQETVFPFGRNATTSMRNATTSMCNADATERRRRYERRFWEVGSLKFNKLKLKWKVFAFLLGFCALLLVILWLFQTVLLDSFYRNIRINGIKRDAATIMSNAGSSDLAELIEGISESSDITVTVTDFNGRNVLRNTQLQDWRSIELSKALISRAREGGGEFYEYSLLQAASPRYVGFPGNRSPMQSLIYVKLAEDESGVAVIINAIISPVNATVTTLRYQLYYISGLMVLLAIILAIIIAKRVSKPIEEINEGALTLAKGDYSTRFSGKGFYEIERLSETLNKAAVELGKVERLRRELLANVSHDLRTPLSLICGYAEMMNDFPGEVTKEQTKVILEEASRLSTLVNDVLDISKLETDMDRLTLSQFNLTESVMKTTMRVEELLRNEGFEIHFQYDKEAIVYADEMKINRAFYNLLVNAVNYSGNSRHIYINQTSTDNRVRISVTDYGEGISTAELPYIWDRYYKSEKAHKRALTGTGLGLSIVKKIVELHCGTYGVASELHKGSTFWFEFGYNRAK